MSAVEIADGPAVDLDAYRIYSRPEIVMLLRELAARRSRLTVYFDRGAGFIVTCLLAVNPDFEELVIDCDSDAAANAQMVRASGLSFVTHLDRIRIQFEAPRAEPTIMDGLPALRVRLPQSMVRLQRREYFRVTTSTVRPLVCETPDPTDPRNTLALRVIDLSAGGLALLAAGDKAPFEIGATLEGCSLDLPEAGRVVFNADVRTISIHTRPKGVRIGCAFQSLPGHANKLIQRQILAMERERQART